MIGLVLLLTLLGPSAVAAQETAAAPAQRVWIPMTDKPLMGGPRTLRLEATLSRPAAPGPTPLRLLLGGMSRGGFLSIVYASLRQTGARGLINFAGGWTWEPCDARIRFHESTRARAGRTSGLPERWLYSENDRNYGPAAVRGYHRAFAGAGGTAGLHVFPPIGHDGHILLPRSVAVWASAVDGFLRQIGMGERG